MAERLGITERLTVIPLSGPPQDRLGISGSLVTILLHPRTRLRRSIDSLVAHALIDERAQAERAYLHWTQVEAGTPARAQATRVEREAAARGVRWWREHADQAAGHHLRRALQRVDPTMVEGIRIGPNIITTAGIAYIIDAWQNLVELDIMRYHGCGTGTAAPTAADTGLQTESTTILNPDSTRATGSQAEGATGAIFHTEATASFDGAGTITEWGLFNAAATGTGTMFARRTQTGLPVVASSMMFFSYEAQFVAA